jgi:hypothetical protein
VYTLGFAASIPPSAPTAILAPPPTEYPDTFIPELTPQGSSALKQYLWTLDSQLSMYLAPDEATAQEQISGAVTMLAAPFAEGTTPDFTDARADQAGATPSPSPGEGTNPVGYVGAFTGLADGSVLVGNYDGWTMRSQCDVS